jgi:putative transposase
MVFTLVQAASKTWQRLRGADQAPRVVEGVVFTKGTVVNDSSTSGST